RMSLALRRVGGVTAPGPSALGRGVVVMADGEIPAPWAGAAVVVVDEAALADPGPLVAELHAAWAARRPVVVGLAVDPARFRQPESWAVEPWTLGPDFEAHLDRLHFLVWANNYDARGPGDPVWWWARKAERLGARPSPSAPPKGELVLPAGTPAWVDGGPRGPISTDDGAAIVHVESVALGRLTPAPPPVAPTAVLAPDQLAAVAHGAGPARVIAPAGSGKTRVLTERLRHLVVDRGFETETVLAVAYNKKAREEMEERCQAFRPRVRTLNALGLALLTEARGRPPAVLEERDLRDLVASLVPRPKRRVNTDPIGPYLDGLSLIRLGLRDPIAVEDSRDDVPGLAEAFAPFRHELNARGAVDFDEQVYGAVELLLTDGEFRRRAQAGCRHLLVDEFQDLTPAHVLLLRLLATPALDVFGVGDDDQVIYGHAGADPDFLVHFDRLFPAAADHPLEVNYRCPVEVVGAARHLLSYNDRRVAKQIRPGPDADPTENALTVRLHAPDAGGESVAQTVTAWLAEPGVETSHIAVLARVNSLLLAPQVALVEAGAAVDSVLRPSVLDRTGVRAALAYLRIGADPENIDGADVVEVYRRPSRGFPQWFPKWLRGRLSIDRLAAMSTRIDDVKVGAKVEELAADLRRVAQAVATGTTATALAVVRDEIGLGGAMGMLDSSRAGEGGSSHLDDLEALAQVAALHPDATSFEPWLRGVLRREATPGGVTLSTIHRVKGREWDRVVVFGATAGLMPHRLAEDVEEERRVLHVAITRGRHRVTLLGDASRPSPFLAELDGTASHDRPRPARRPDPATATSPRSPREPPVLAALPADAEATEAALRAWRTERARSDGVPPYIVLSDKYLRGIAVARPTSLVMLRLLPGIGPTKLELYGDEIVAVIAEAAEQVTGPA
ncbi:MAG: ATP-dependent helicase UvrD/PcrA, partial [Actinomycetota bacterium]|nr:ATP-dependent helicase UvrD/PcrA [Actinomycetota bacterium]